MKLFCSLLNPSAGHSNTLVLRRKHSLTTAPNFLQGPSLPGRSTSEANPGKDRAQVSPTLGPCPLQIEPLLPFLAGGTPGTGGEGLSAEWGERPGDLGRGRGGRGPGEVRRGRACEGGGEECVAQERGGGERRGTESCARWWDVQKVAEEGVGRGAEAGGGGVKAGGGGARQEGAGRGRGGAARFSGGRFSACWCYGRYTWGRGCL